jgi:hypothetical protein
MEEQNTRSTRELTANQQASRSNPSTTGQSLHTFQLYLDQWWQHHILNKAYLK